MFYKFLFFRKEGIYFHLKNTVGIFLVPALLLEAL